MGKKITEIYIFLALPLPDCVSSKVRLFADDCLLYREIRSPSDQEKLQTDLKNLET